MSKATAKLTESLRRTLKFSFLLFLVGVFQSSSYAKPVRPLSQDQLDKVLRILPADEALAFQDAHTHALEEWQNREEHDFETDLELPPGELDIRGIPNSNQLHQVLSPLVERFERDYRRRFRRQLFKSVNDVAKDFLEKPDREKLLAAIDQRLQSLEQDTVIDKAEMKTIVDAEYRNIFCQDHQNRAEDLIRMELLFIEATISAHAQYNSMGGEKFIRKVRKRISERIENKRQTIFDGIERGEYRDEYEGYAVKLTTIGSNGDTQIIGKVTLPSKQDAVIALNLPLSINNRALDADTTQVKKFQMRLAHQEGGISEESFNVLLVSRTEGRYRALDYLNLPFLVSWKRLKLYINQAVQSGKTADLKLALFFSLPLQLTFLSAGLISENTALIPSLSALLIKGSYIFLCAQFSDTYERLVRSKNPLVEMTLKSLYVFPVNLAIMMILNGVDRPSTYVISFALSILEKSASVMMIKWIRFLEEQRRLKGQYHWNFGPFRQPRKVVFWREQMATVRSVLAAVGLTKDATSTVEIAGENIPFPVGILGLAGVSFGFHRYAEWQATKLKKYYEQKASEADISTSEGLEKQKSYLDLADYFEEQKKSLKNVRLIIPGLYPLVEKSVKGSASLCQKGLSRIGLTRPMRSSFNTNKL